MAAVPVEIRGTLYDIMSKSSRQVFIVGEASRSDLIIGGGPVYPDPVEPPLGIWGPTDPRPTPPIVIPPNVPPGMQPPSPPNPGDPTTPVPPPGGSSGWPVQPIVPPDYIIVNYPGVGPVYVAPPLTAQPK